MYERLAKKFEFDPESPHTIDELRQTLDLQIVPDRPISVRKPGLIFEAAGREARILIDSLYTRGSAVRAAFKLASSKVRKSTVEVRSRGKIVALGTVIDSNGRLLTKASELPRRRGRLRDLKCRLHDGTYTAAKFISEDKDFDVALLQISSKQVEPIHWEDENLQTGQWLISVGRSGYAHTVGIVSVLGRTIDRVSGFMGIGPAQESPGGYSGARVGHVRAKRPAARAGVQSGDLITHVDNTAIANFAMLKNVVGRYNAGDHVKLSLTRDGKEKVFYMRLDKRRHADNSPDSLHGETNARSGGFPLAVQHDSVMSDAKCGGPVVDASGKVVGINIARAERTASYMIPARRLRGIINKLKTK